jgi:phage gpG-like protein
VITVQLIGDNRPVAKLEAMPGRVHDGLARAVPRLGFELQHKVRADTPWGQVLKVRTGSLRSSINMQLEGSATEVAATIGTNIQYARRHEYGHSWLVEAKSVKPLRFTVGDQTMFRRRVTHPPLPERSFLRSALAEMAPSIAEGLHEAVAEAIR